MRRPKAQGDHPRQVTNEMVRREPLPLARAILWKPLPDSYHLLASMMRSTENQAHLFVTQRAFLQVERHLCSAPDLQLGGFLAGQLYECPRTQRRYSIVTTVIPLADVSEEPIGARVTQEAVDTVRTRLDSHRLSLIGWYRNTTGLGLQLLPDDVETHLAYFNEPWQTTMLVLPDASRPKGAFFTYDPRVGRGYCIPFYELFDAHAAETNRLARTCVGWKTYVAAAPVEPLAVAEKEIVETIVAPIPTAPPEPPPREPIDEWWDAIKDPWVRLKDVAAPAKRREDPVAPVAQPPRAPRPVAPREPNGRQRPSTPAGPSKPRVEQALPALPLPAPRPSPPRRTSLEEVVPTPPTFYEQAIQQVHRKLVEADSLDAQTAGGNRWWRRRNVGIAVIALFVLTAITLATVRSRPGQQAQAAVPVAASAEPAAEPGGSMTGPMVAIPLVAAVDSLSRALDHYRDVANSHRKGAVSCSVLNRAYSLVGRARARLEASRQAIAGGLADSDSIRVSMLAAEFTFVAQTYRRSGCQR